MKDLTGQRFGRLKVINFAEKAQDKKHTPLWVCLCDCGNVSIVRQNNLHSNHTTSCGCLLYEGLLKANRTHGMYKSRLYAEWTSIKRRCYNPHAHGFNLYGGRGIGMCVGWYDSFEKFRDWAIANGYSDDLTIERIDVNGHYLPSNCKWIPLEEQQYNKRNSLTNITIDGRTMHMAKWCEEKGLNYFTVRHRIYDLGWDPVRAITEPTQHQKKIAREKILDEYADRIEVLS